MSTLLSSHRSSIESMLCSVRSGNRPKNLAMNWELSRLQLSAPFTPARISSYSAWCCTGEGEGL